MKRKNNDSIDKFFSKEKSKTQTEPPTKKSNLSQQKSKKNEKREVDKKQSSNILKRITQSTGEKKSFSSKKTKKILVGTPKKPKRRNKEQHKGVLYTLIQCSLTLLFVVIPLFFTTKTLQGINFEKTIFLTVVTAVLFTLAFLKIILAKKISFLKTPFDKVLPIFLLILLISTIFSVDKWHSFFGFFIDPSKGFFTALSGIVLFYLFINFLDTSEAKRALRPLIASGVIVSIYVFLVNFLLIPPDFVQHIPYNPLGSLKSLAIFLSVALPLFLAGILLLSQIKRKFITAIGTVMLTAATILAVLDLLVIKNIVSWGSLLFGILFFTYLVYFKKEPKTPLQSFRDNFSSKLVLSLIVIVALVGGLMLSQYGNYLSLKPKIRLTREVQVGIPLTVEIAQKSLTTGYKQAFLGSGPATFSYDFAKFHPTKLIFPNKGIKYFYQGDGLLGEAIPTIGILGALLMIWLTMVVIKEIFITPWSETKILNKENFSFNKIYFAGLSSSLLIWLLNAFTKRIDAGTAFLGLLITSLAFAFILRQKKEKNLTVNLRKPSMVMIGFNLFLVSIFIVLIAGAGYNIQRFITDVKLAQIIFADRQNTVNTLPKLKEIIYNHQSREGYYYLRLAEATALSITVPTDKENKDNIKKENSEKITSAFQYAKQANRLMPNNIETVNTLIGIYANYESHKKEELRKLYLKAIELEPESISNYLSLGDLFIANAFSEQDKNKKNKLIDQAVQWYGKALSMDKKSAVIYDRLATAYYLKGNTDKAIISTAKAVLLVPENIFYKINLAKLYQIKGDQDSLNKAKKILSSLIKKYPNNLKVLTEMAIFYEETGQIDKAKEFYKKIINLLQNSKNGKALKKHFEKLLQNLEEGKINFPVKNRHQEKQKGSVQQWAEKISIESNSNKNGSEKEQSNSAESKMVTISVDSEGPINVRADASLSAQKLTKIRETGRFRKIDEKGNWVQIIIPAQDGQEEIKGWVHKKFVTE